MKLEQPARAQHPVHFAHIILDDLAARDVLEDDHRKGEIELQPRADSEAPPPMRRHRGEILAVVANHVRAWKDGHPLARPPTPRPPPAPPCRTISRLISTAQTSPK